MQKLFNFKGIFLFILVCFFFFCVFEYVVFKFDFGVFVFNIYLVKVFFGKIVDEIVILKFNVIIDDLYCF